MPAQLVSHNIYEEIKPSLHRRIGEQVQPGPGKSGGRTDMKQLVVISGKGGTGKTSMVA